MERTVETARTIEPETDRLYLRQWHPSDLVPFAEMNADPRVMEHFPAVLSRAASDAMAQRCHALIAERGWGLWAAELKSTGEFIGFVGLHTPSADLPFSPCVEVGWRLALRFWGQGYATEGGRAALRVAFDELGEKEVVSFTAVRNMRSRAVMTRLGMHDAERFEHPHIPEGHVLRPHCLYRLSAQDGTVRRPGATAPTLMSGGTPARLPFGQPLSIPSRPSGARPHCIAASYAATYGAARICTAQEFGSSANRAAAAGGAPD